MGSDPRRDKDADADEQPQHRVHLPEYSIARVPVTLRQFVAFVEATDYRTQAERQGSEFTWYQPYGRGSDARHKAQHPVTCISWDDALALCQWANVRLPSEVEWEKAARGTDGRIYPWGDQSPTAQLCNCNRWVGETTPVERYPNGASPFGVLDMAGNVWEWCGDWYEEDAYRKRAGREVRNPVGPKSGTYRILRGGSWYNDRLYVRCAFRNRYYPDDGNVNLGGFRVARGSPN
jgi:formylglycine-generating enzyme required for sulfatase activity